MILRLFGAGRFCHSNVAQTRKLTTSSVKRPRIKLKWLILGAAATGTGAYTLNVLLPDSRAEHDPLHYYSDYKVFWIL